jgi:hypothetical protein
VNTSTTPKVQYGYASGSANTIRPTAITYPDGRVITYDYGTVRMLHRAQTLQDLRVPPGNRLEALKGDRKGQHSIRVNDQFRICFVWRSGDAYEVEIVDYH